MILFVVFDVSMGFIFGLRSSLMIPPDELLEFSPLNQFFYQFFLVMIFISVMTMILMKTVVLLWVTLPG